MNANELADELEKLYRFKCHEAAVMLRKQDYEIQDLQEWKRSLMEGNAEQQAEIEALKEPKIPLLDQEIKFILGNGQCWQGEDCSMPNLMYIIRAVEAAHGIGVKQNEQ